MMDCVNMQACSALWLIDVRSRSNGFCSSSSSTLGSPPSGFLNVILTPVNLEVVMRHLPDGFLVFNCQLGMVNGVGVVIELSGYCED